jgi:hypothetical protein
MGRVGLGFTVAVLLVSSATVAAQTPSPARSPAPTSTASRAPFQIEAKILRTGRVWTQVEVLRVTQGTGLRMHGKLWVKYTTKTKFLKAGKGVSFGDLRVGKTVAIRGTASGRGPGLTYQAASVTIMK